MNPHAGSNLRNFRMIRALSEEKIIMPERIAYIQTYLFQTNCPLCRRQQDRS